MRHARLVLVSFRSHMAAFPGRAEALGRFPRLSKSGDRPPRSKNVVCGIVNSTACHPLTCQDMDNYVYPPYEQSNVPQVPQYAYNPYANYQYQQNQGPPVVSGPPNNVQPPLPTTQYEVVSSSGPGRKIFSVYVVSCRAVRVRTELNARQSRPDSVTPAAQVSQQNVANTQG